MPNAAAPQPTLVSNVVQPLIQYHVSEVDMMFEMELELPAVMHETTPGYYPAGGTVLLKEGDVTLFRLTFPNGRIPANEFFRAQDDSVTHVICRGPIESIAYGPQT